MVTDQQSDSKGGEADNASASLFSYSHIFHELFPHYLVMGMTASEYWDGDPTLVRDYLEAYKIRRSNKNWEMWMQGMYVYEALCCASPLMQAFAKKGTKAHPYTSEPYPLTEKEREAKRLRDERKVMLDSIEKMKRYAADFNSKFDKKER